jgi:glycosyltransferase involved in cell wall biosynthesis
LGCVRKTHAKLREIGPDIVHGQGTERDCAISAATSGFPNIITIHGNMREVAKALKAPFFSYHTLQTMLETFAIRRTIGVLCLTNYTRAQVEGRTARTWILPNAVNESYFEMKRAAEFGNKILCIANIDDRKNQNFLIRALDPIAEKMGIRVVFLGVAATAIPYVREFLELVKTRPWCSYEGFKRGPELTAHLLSARMIVLPSLEENCPMVVLEGMAVGTPVAAARTGGTPDLIEEGVSGLMFNPTNAEELRAAVLKIFHDDGTARAFGEAGRKRALEKHLPVRIAERHVEIYREAIGAGRGK